MHVSWDISFTPGDQPLQTYPLQRAQAMRRAIDLAQAGSLNGKRYQDFPDYQIGIKRLSTEKVIGGRYVPDWSKAYQEANQMRMAKLRAAKIGVKVPEIFGIMAARISDSWQLFLVMEHIAGVTVDIAIGGAWYSSVAPATQPLRNQVEEALKSVGAGHNDLHGGNVLVLSGRLVVIDWEGPRMFKRDKFDDTRFRRVAGIERDR